MNHHPADAPSGHSVWRRCLRAGALLLLALAAACVTPVIPLPPPEPALLDLTIKDASSELLVISTQTGTSSMYVRAFAIVWNVDTNQGVVTRTSDSDGSFTTPPFKASDGQHLELWVRWLDGSEASTIRRLKVVYLPGNKARLDEERQ